jgi:hypothetical protein
VEYKINKVLVKTTHITFEKMCRISTRRLSIHKTYKLKFAVTKIFKKDG